MARHLGGETLWTVDFRPDSVPKRLANQPLCIGHPFCVGDDWQTASYRENHSKLPPRKTLASPVSGPWGRYDPFWGKRHTNRCTIPKHSHSCHAAPKGWRAFGRPDVSFRKTDCSSKRADTLPSVLPYRPSRTARSCSPDTRTPTPIRWEIGIVRYQARSNAEGIPCSRSKKRNQPAAMSDSSSCWKADGFSPITACHCC